MSVGEPFGLGQATTSMTCLVIGESISSTVGGDRGDGVGQGHHLRVGGFPGRAHRPTARAHRAAGLSDRASSQGNVGFAAAAVAKCSLLTGDRQPRQNLVGVLWRPAEVYIFPSAPTHDRVVRDLVALDEGILQCFATNSRLTLSSAIRRSRPVVVEPNHLHRPSALGQVGRRPWNRLTFDARSRGVSEVPW